MLDSTFSCHGNGKLLLSGEYFILDGALGLAVPVSMGQQFEVRPVNNENGEVTWTSLDHRGNPWFRAAFRWGTGAEPDLQAVDCSDDTVAERIIQLMNAAAGQCAELPDLPAIAVKTRLEFPNDWGFGSSSTLVHCLSRWLDIDPYLLLEQSFGGSGYDIACAGARSPLFFRRGGQGPEVQPVNLKWPFKDQLHFVYLGEKQDSREGIWHYQTHKKDTLAESIESISRISKAMASSGSLSEFMDLMDLHEQVVARALDLARVKGHRFPEFNGSIKSLGAWGGDFCLAASPMEAGEVHAYFKSRGCQTVLSWNEIILEPEP